MPAKFAAIKRAAKRFGARVDKPKSGSHWKVTSPSGVVYPIPAHGKNPEIGDEYIRGLCRAMGWDLDEFKGEL